MHREEFFNRVKSELANILENPEEQEARGPEPFDKLSEITDFRELMHFAKEILEDSFTYSLLEWSFSPEEWDEFTIREKASMG